MFHLRNRRTVMQGAQANEKKKYMNRKNLAVWLRVFAYVKPYTGHMVIAVIALSVSVLLGLILPLVIKNLVDVVLADQNMTMLNQLAIGLMVVFIIQAIFSFIHRLSLAHVGQRVVADIRVDVYRHLQRLSLRYFTNNPTGEIVSRLTSDVTRLQASVTDNLTALLRQVLTLIGGVVFLLILDWQLTLLIMVGVPLVVLTMFVMGRYIRKAAKIVQDRLAEAADVIQETTAGVRIVKSFAMEDYEIGRYSDRVEGIFDAAMYRAKLNAILGPVIGLLAFLSITLTLWFGSIAVIEGRLSAGGLVAYLVYTMMVAGPVATIAGLYGQFQSALGATERLFDLLDTEPDIDDPPDAVPLPAITGTVQFDGVSFHYSEGTPVLENISFTAQPGQVVAFVGPSGAGKTTIINLIPRFYDVSTGQVTIDGYDLRSVTLRSLRAQIGIVSQDPILFSETVAHNIRYGQPTASDADVAAAAKAANAHDFILNELADGYQTRVGERGVKLSGGQRQRVAIARALLNDPRILILDEATSSLDSESEALVQEALERLMAGRTTFVIAHRLSTVINADWIVVVNRGEVVEQGKHADLISNTNGLYHRLYHLQFSANTVDPLF